MSSLLNSVPAVEVPVAAAQPGRGITRAQVVTLGQTGSAWAFVPVALAALQQQPADLEVRFLLAAAYAKLMLKTAAAEQLALLGPGAQSDPSVKALAELLPSLPEDRVPLAELVGTLTGNLEALASRTVEALDLRGRVNAWKLVNTPVEWFRARSGSLVRRKRGDAGGWLQFGDQAEQARGFAMPHAGSPGVPPPYVVEGADPPWLFKRVCEGSPVQADGHAPLVMLLQADEGELLTGLAQCDLRRELSDPRVRVFVGAAALKRWVEWMTERAMGGVAVSGPCLGLPTLKAKMSPTPEQVITSLVSRQQQEYQRLDAWAKARWGTVDRSAIAARLASPGDRPLRVLIPTYRHSTFIKHSAADLSAALGALGCETRVMMEPDDHSSITNLAHLKTLEEFGPDLVVQINYTRQNLGGVYPPGIVWATWVQDAMGHLFDKGAGAAQGRTDFLVGATRDDLFQFFGYPRARAMYWPMVASSRKFHDKPVSDEQRGRLACEIAYVSHHGATARALHDERVSMVRATTPALVGVFEALYPEIERFVASPGLLDARMSLRLRELTAGVLGGHGVTGDHAVTQVLNAYTMQIADRMLRHQTLEWAAAIAVRRGWRLHIFGKGWSQHPTLAGHAKGELHHGDDLRACYQLARAHLQVSAHTVIHQRVAECALSGGLALCRLQGDDLGTLEFQAGAEAVIDGVEPVACDPWRMLELGHRLMGYRAADHASTVGFAELCRGLGLGERGLVWMNTVMIERLRARATYQGRELPARQLLGDPGAVLFTSEASLEAALERAVRDDGWREATRRRVVASAEKWLTYDALGRRLLAFIAESLGRDQEPDLREWYDGRARA